MCGDLQNLGTGETRQKSEKGFRKRLLCSQGGEGWGGESPSNLEPVAGTWFRLTQLQRGGCGLVTWDIQGTGHQT